MGNPVFNDASGARVSAIQWGSRIFLALIVLLAAALALTLRSHVSVPGLERLVPGLDANEVRTGPSNPPAERGKVATGSSTVRPEPDTRPTTSLAGVPTVDTARSADARRAVAPTSAEPSSAPRVRPTNAVPTVSAGRISASPTVRAGGQGTVKPRNPQAATPSPPQQAPGQTRTPKQPTTDIG